MLPHTYQESINIPPAESIPQAETYGNTTQQPAVVATAEQNRRSSSTRLQALFFVNTLDTHGSHTYISSGKIPPSGNPAHDKQRIHTQRPITTRKTDSRRSIQHRKDSIAQQQTERPNSHVATVHRRRRHFALRRTPGACGIAFGDYTSKIATHQTQIHRSRHSRSTRAFIT